MGPAPERDRRSGPPDWRRGLVEASPYLGLGMQLAFAMAGFTGAGYLLDAWLETLPWLTIAGATLGMVAVFVQIVRVSNDLNRRSGGKNKSSAPE